MVGLTSQTLAHRNMILLTEFLDLFHIGLVVISRLFIFNMNKNKNEYFHNYICTTTYIIIIYTRLLFFIPMFKMNSPLITTKPIWKRSKNAVSNFMFRCANVWLVNSTTGVNYSIIIVPIRGSNSGENIVNLTT